MTEQSVGLSSRHVVVIDVRHPTIVLCDARRTAAELETSGKLRAAQALREKADRADACCDVAPGKLLSLRLEILKSNCRVIAQTGIDPPVEVWLRLWCLRCISTKDLTSLTKFKQMFPKRVRSLVEQFDASEEEEQEEIDLIQQPCLYLIIPKIAHEDAAALAAHYFAEAFFG